MYWMLPYRKLTLNVFDVFAAIHENADQLQTAEITQMPEQYALPLASPCACARRSS